MKESPSDDFRMEEEIAKETSTPNAQVEEQSGVMGIIAKYKWYLLIGFLVFMMVGADPEKMET